MALADILSRIECDAAEEAARIERAAQAKGEELIAESTANAEAEAARIVAAATRDAQAEASTLLAAARLEARDRALAEKRSVVAEALEGVAAAIAALPAEQYARFLGGAIAAQARTGDVVALAASDLHHLEAIRETVHAVAPGLSLTWSDEPAQIDRGALVIGGRTRAEITPQAIVAERRDQLEVIVSARLFEPREG